MPYLSIQTNVSVDDATSAQLLEEASREVSRALNKPEEFFMGAVQANLHMIFGGSREPVAFFELKALGLPGQKTKDLSRILCQMAEHHLKVPKARTYVKFIDVQRGMWGWNGETFD